jgi:hypothetical protein
MVSRETLFSGTNGPIDLRFLFCISLVRGIQRKTDEKHRHRADGSSHQPLIGSIKKRGAAGINGRARDAKRGMRDASYERIRVLRHRRNPFSGNNLVRSVTQVTLVTLNRGPLRPGGFGGD